MANANGPNQSWAGVLQSLVTGNPTYIPTHEDFMDKFGPAIAAAFVGPAAFGALGDAFGATASAADTFAGQPIGMSTAGGVPDTGFGASVSAPAGGGGGGFADSIMNNPFAGGGGVGMPATTDFSGAGLGNLSAGTGGLGMAGPLGGGSAVAGSSPSLFDTVSKFLGSPIGGAVGNAATSLLMGNQLNKLAGQQANYSSLDQSQRQPYQANLSQLVNNPSQYLSTDPFATSLANYYKNSVIPRNVAASGNPGQVLDQQGSQFVNALSGNYNTQVGQLSGIAGFGFPQSQYAGYGAGQIGVGGVQQQGNALAGLGNAFGQNFSKLAQGQSGTTGLFGTGFN